jgi:hypothetical protein
MAAEHATAATRAGSAIDAALTRLAGSYPVVY